MGLNSKYKGAEIEALLDEVNAGVNVYYTSFTVEDIWQIYYEETYERIVLDAGLIQAINDKKVIVVPSRSGTPRQLIMLYDINPDYNTCQFRFVGAKGYFYMAPFDIVDFKVGYIIDFLSNAGWYDYANPEVAPIANTLVLRDDDSTIQIGRLKELSTNTTWVLPTYKGSGYDYRLQEHLVSGQNIRTINGISIVGRGNIPINSYDYYVLRNFSFNDLFDAVLHGEELSYGSGEIQDIIDAFERKIPVFIERDFDDGYKSLILVTGYAEDLLYLTINDGYEIINVECSRNGVVDYFFPTLISLSDLDAVKLNLENVEDGLGILSEQYADTIEALGDKVDKVSGKGLSTNDYTTTEKNKLAGIAAGAEVNVQSDWNVTDSSSDAYIKNKPTIPSAVTESTVSSWGFTKNTGTYSKPSGGIPKSDLASAIQTSLGKADTALQSYTEQYKGTVTGVKVNGNTYSPTNGVVDLGTISGGGETTPQYYVIQSFRFEELLYKSNDGIFSDYFQNIGEIEQITNAFNNKIPVYINRDYPEDGFISMIPVTGFAEDFLYLTIVDGDNVLTIEASVNSEMDVEEYSWHRYSLCEMQSQIGGGGSSNGGSSAYPQVSHGTSGTTFSLTPNTFHVWDEVSELTITLGDETEGVANEYVFQFTSGVTPTALTLPDFIKWTNNTPPTISANKIYQISILNNLAVCLEFDNISSELIVNKLRKTAGGMDYATYTLEYPAASDIIITLRNAMGSEMTLKINKGDTEVKVTENMLIATMSFHSISPMSDDIYVYEYSL